MEPLTPLDFYFSGPGLESPRHYLPGGYHPVHLGDVYCDRYKVINKLGFGTYSTVWLACDLKSTTQTRYVALKFVVAKLTGKNNEVKIHHHLAARSGTHPGSDRVLAPLDRFEVEGPNGKHDVLVFKVMGPQLSDMYNNCPSIIRQAIKSLAHQIALGISFLHDCGVVHADLHSGNIAFEIPDLDGKSEEDAMRLVGLPKCVPVLIRNRAYQTDSLPRYFVFSRNLVKRVKRDALRVKIIDLGEAFISTGAPAHMHSPLQVRAPEAILNHFMTPLRIEFGPPVDVWSVGCLIFELAMSMPLVNYAALNEMAVLDELMAVLGPLPEEWVFSLGASYVASTRDTPLEEWVRSDTKVDDTPGLIQLLQQILVFDPLRRPSASDLLKHPWFVGSSDAAIGPAPESDSSSSEDSE